MKSTCVWKRSIAILVSALFLTTQLAACSSVSDIKYLRGLPGRSYESDFKKAFYDEEILAYWVPVYAEGSPRRGKALRDSTGKKVRTEEEFQRLWDAKEEVVLGTGAEVAVWTLTIILLPVVIVWAVVDGILSIPGSLYGSRVLNTYQAQVEKDYAEARMAFAEGQHEDALNLWTRALDNAASLRAFSDIDYWRGRAFHELKKQEEAWLAFLTFVNYSESSVPKYFDNQYEDDPSWLEKAEDAQSRIWSFGYGAGSAGANLMEDKVVTTQH